MLGFPRYIVHFRALTSGDVDSDEYKDLLIGAPGYSVKNFPQTGKVFILFGKNLQLSVHIIILSTRKIIYEKFFVLHDLH